MTTSMSKFNERLKIEYVTVDLYKVETSLIYQVWVKEVEDYMPAVSTSITWLTDPTKLPTFAKEAWKKNKRRKTANWESDNVKIKVTLIRKAPKDVS